VSEQLQLDAALTLEKKVKTAITQRSRSRQQRLVKWVPITQDALKCRLKDLSTHPVTVISKVTTVPNNVCSVGKEATHLIQPTINATRKDTTVLNPFQS